MADPGFSLGGSTNPQRAPTFAKNCMKLEDFGPQGGHAYKILLCRSAIAVYIMFTGISPLFSTFEQYVTYIDITNDTKLAFLPFPSFLFISLVTLILVAHMWKMNTSKDKYNKIIDLD